ncbi:redoxin domain-containing protein [Puteibacter caeruleilacunae]|nr:redoxin domain-containing protein [Puteibacter caeruleilacunae]
MKILKIVLIIVTSIIALIATALLTIGYLNYKGKYPNSEFRKVKRHVFDNPREAAMLFIDLVDKVEVRKDAEKYMEKYRYYIVDQVVVYAVSEPSDSTLNVKLFLDDLWNGNNGTIKGWIEPYHLYEKITSASSDEERIRWATQMMNGLRDHAQFDNKYERYALLTYQWLDSVSSDHQLKDRILERTKQNLNKTSYSDYNQQEWKQYMTSYAYYLSYKKAVSSENKEYCIYWLDEMTKSFPVNVSDNFKWEEKVMGVSIKDLGLVHVNYYLDRDEKEKAFSVLTKLTLKNPFLFYDINAAIRRREQGSSLTKKLWFESLACSMPKTPTVKYISTKGLELDLSGNPKKWVFIDFWGTWCSPCKKQLPEIQAFYEHNKDKIEVFTISKGSSNLNSFMAENNYTFPVADVETIEGFTVTSFPTKILISPDGYFVKVPHSDKWIEYIEKITLLELNN